VYLPNKSLYGLKQSPRKLHKQFDSFMIKARYNRYKYDSCVYFKQSDDPTYLLLCVDDMLIAARNKTYVQKLKAQLKKEFDMKDLGEAKKILGRRSLETEAQADFGYPRRTVLKVLERFNMAEARPVTTLLAGHFKLSSNQYP